MDVRLSAEQVVLRDAAAQMVDRLGPTTVAAIEDGERSAKLDAAIEASGWRELRSDGGKGRPWASAVEAGVVAEELGRGLGGAPFLGPTLAADLRRLTGAPAARGRETVALARSLDALADGSAAALAVDAVAIDAAGASTALVLVRRTDVRTLGTVSVGSRTERADLTRRSIICEAGSAVAEVGALQALDGDAIDRWHSLALAITCADLVGVMRGALRLACQYARVRRQYGSPIGSFQALQHLLADACVATEGSRSVALHAAWAVDALAAGEALAAASVAKAYCARAARSVCETAIQVHGGIGNTWDCLAHVYLRRAVLSADLFGGIGPSLDRVLAAHGVGGVDGLR